MKKFSSDTSIDDGFSFDSAISNASKGTDKRKLDSWFMDSCNVRVDYKPYLISVNGSASIDRRDFNLFNCDVSASFSDFFKQTFFAEDIYPYKGVGIITVGDSFIDAVNGTDNEHHFSVRTVVNGNELHDVSCGLSAKVVADYLLDEKSIRVVRVA